jgi:hypothetical protein
MLGYILYTHMYKEPLYGEKIMMKKIVRVISYIPLQIVKWSLFPVAFLHAQLKRLEDWLYDKAN